jgi:hypothetical protein
MGMSNIAYYMALVLRYTISYLIISVGTMVILQQLVFKNSLLILLIVWHFMFCLALTAQAFFISSFFTYVKKALFAGIFFFAFNFFVIFLINYNAEISYIMKLISSISPHNSYNLSLQIVMYL